MSRWIYKCPVDGCTRNRKSDQVCCAAHWFALPKAVRDDIWRLYRDAAGSDEHRAAVFNAIAWLNAKASQTKLPLGGTS